MTIKKKVAIHDESKVSIVKTIEENILEKIEKVESSSRYGASADKAYELLKDFVTMKDVALSGVIIPDIDCTIAFIHKKISDSPQTSEEKIYQAIADAHAAFGEFDYI